MRKISYRFVYNRKKSLNDRGTALVQVEAYLNKKKVYFSTHVYLRPEQWDVKRKIIKEHPNQDALNGMLNEFIIELEKKELSLWRQGKTITLSLIKEEFKSNTDASFLGFARKEIMSSQLKDSTKRNHLTTISLLQSFKPTIEFEDLTYNFVTDFEKFLYDSDYQTNTVAKHMKHLKSFVNAAINKGYIDPNNYAFRRYKIKMKEGKHVFLLPEEMKKLEEVSLIGRNSCSAGNWVTVQPSQDKSASSMALTFGRRTGPSSHKGLTGWKGPDSLWRRSHRAGRPRPIYSHTESASALCCETR